MEKTKKFIIFAHSRSGSNSLVNILRCNNIKIITEPFNISWQKESNPSLVNKIAGIRNATNLDHFIDELFKEYNGIKTLVSQLGEGLNKHMLSNKDCRIVFLSRKNLLKAIISSKISEKINIWGTRKNNVKVIRKIIFNEKFENMPLAEIKKNIENLNSKIIYYKKFLCDNKINFFEVYYEDIYSQEISFFKKIKKINEIFEFLGFNKAENLKILEKIKNILDPENEMINDEKTYKSIPNILQIENELGNEENGHLFNEKLNKMKDELKKIKKFSVE